ncbi:MAG: hypothetical protein ACE5KY_07375, partial [Candidatus Tectimicrobiota bacterium]
VLRGDAGGGSSWSTLAGAVARGVLFYGYAYPVLALGGLLVARRVASRPAFLALGAYGLAFVVLVALRGLGGGLFKDLKEILFVAPLVAVLSGGFLHEMARRHRAARVAVVLATAGLMAFGINRYRYYFETYAHPVVAVTEAAEES